MRLVFLFRRLRIHALPVLIWGTAVWGVGQLFQHHTAAVRIEGLARGRVYQVAPVYESRIVSLPVGLFQPVKKGQVVAVLDDSVVVGQIAAIAAEKERLVAEFEENMSITDADIQNRVVEWVGETRSYDSEIADFQIKRMELQTVLAEDRASLTALKLDVDSQEELTRHNVAPPFMLARAKSLYEAMVGKIAANEKLLVKLEAEEKAACARRDQYAVQQPIHPSIAASKLHLEKALRVQDGLMQELEAMRADYVLRSPADGIIVPVVAKANDDALRRPGEGLLRSPGEAVAAGEPILAVAERTPTEIIAYATEEQAEALEPGKTVEVTANRPRKQTGSAQVVAIAPTIDQIPQRLWANPTLPAWGRPVLVAIPKGMQLRPGELVSIRKAAR